MEKLTVRAVTAYYRSLQGEQEEVPVEAQHSGFDSRGYILLRHRHSGQLLAVYRCMNRGELKRLKRWPVELVTPMPPESAAKESPVNPVAPTVPSSHLLLDLIPLPRKAVTAPSGEPGAEQADLF